MKTYLTYRRLVEMPSYRKPATTTAANSTRTCFGRALHLIYDLPRILTLLVANGIDTEVETVEI